MTLQNTPGLQNTPNRGYGARIDRLQDRLKTAGKGNRKQLRNRIGDLRAQRYLHRQNERPDPTLPFDAEYDTTVGGLARNRDTALANNAYARQMTQQSYGFDNPTANPYSRAAILQRSFDQFNRGTVNNAAASGQLYSGSTQTNLDQGLFNFGQEWNTARTEYEDSLRELADKDIAARTEYEEGVQGAEAKRLAAALEEEVDPGMAPDTPKSVKNYVKGQKKTIRQLDKKGKDQRADKLRRQLKKLGVKVG